MEKYFDFHPAFEPFGTAREMGLENILASAPYKTYQLEHSRMYKHLPLKNILASTYLCKAESHLSQLVSPENLHDILSVAEYFPGNVTSFLGFECRLGKSESRADWAFAISGTGNDRIVLENLLHGGYLPDSFFNHPEWQHIADFATSWADPTSVLKNKVKCFWLEFDMPENPQEVPIPSVFFGPTSLPANVSPNDVSQYEWLITTAFPLLAGHKVSKAIEYGVQNCIRKMPSNASLFQVGTMLSRSTKGIRLYINKIQPEQIIPYLNTIGWSDTKGEFTSLVTDLKNKADRFVLSFDVTETGIGPRIGLECSFAPDRFDQETRWNQLLHYLVKKGWCLPEKRDALLSYPGEEQDENFSGGVMKPLTSASQNLSDIISGIVVRYISHLKLVYEPGNPIEAKAYPAVRLFERSQDSTFEHSQMVTEEII